MATARAPDEDVLSTMQFVAAMKGMFPSISASRICQIVEKHGKSVQDEIVDELLCVSELDDESRIKMEADVPNIGLDAEPAPDEFLKARCELFRCFLPDADPEFLQQKAVELSDDGEDEIREWLNHAMETHDYPTLVEYLKRRECKDTLHHYANMKPDEFLHQVFVGRSDPETFYSNKDRALPSELYKTNAATLVRILFTDVEEAVFEAALDQAGSLLVPAVKCLEAAGHCRSELPCYEAFETTGALDLAFVQEMTFLRMEKEICKVLHDVKLERQQAKASARAAGALFECHICMQDDVLLRDVLECSVGSHMFCVSCVRRQAEVASSEARSTVSCLEHQCPGFFPLSQLRGTIAPSLLGSLLKAVQRNELKQAALDSLLEPCPFCSFSCEIENQRMEVFRCLNPVCRIDSCRMCKKVAHGSVPCKEGETDAQTKARLLLEEKLTSAIVRPCPRCKKQVIKVEGCNHMTCLCGAEFCYVCRQEIEDVSGHYEDGSCDQFEGSSAIHNRDLSQAVQEGREEVQDKFGNVELAHDPTAHVEMLMSSDEEDSSSDDDSGLDGLGMDRHWDAYLRQVMLNYEREDDMERVLGRSGLDAPNGESRGDENDSNVEITEDPPRTVGRESRDRQNSCALL